jgi:hypothetical protein
MWTRDLENLNRKREAKPELDFCHTVREFLEMLAVSNFSLNRAKRPTTPVEAAG